MQRKSIIFDNIALRDVCNSRKEIRRHKEGAEGMAGWFTDKVTEGRGQPRYRHEWKFLCTQPQITLLESQLGSLMEKDRHSGSAGVYTVRSLYFDDYGNHAMKQKEDGLDHRKKYRIRSYLQGEEGPFHLEIKHREGDRIRKESCSLSAEEVRQVLAGGALEYGTGAAQSDSVRNRFRLAQERALLRPAVIVEYERIPYVFPDGNVRITIDKNICSAPETDRFLERDIMAIPILEKGRHLLEIKYDEYLPDVIRQAIQTVSLERTSFSKYYLCRLAGGPLKMGWEEGADG